MTQNKATPWQPHIITTKNLVCLWKKLSGVYFRLLKSLKFKNKPSSLTLVLLFKQSGLIKERLAIFGLCYLCHLMSDVVKSVEERMQGRQIVFLSVLTTGLWAAALWQTRRPLYGVWSCRIGVEWTESLHMVRQTSSAALSRSPSCVGKTLRKSTRGCVCSTTCSELLSLVFWISAALDAVCG